MTDENTREEIDDVAVRLSDRIDELAGRQLAAKERSEQRFGEVKDRVMSLERAVEDAAEAGEAFADQADDLVNNQARFDHLPDGESFSAVSPWKRTLKYNSTADDHEHEYQIYNVNQVSDGNYRIPVYEPDNDSSSDGRIYWYAPDADSGAGLESGIRKSLQFIDNGDAAGNGDRYLQLYDFADAAHDPLNGPTSSDFVVMKDVSEEKIIYVNDTAMGAWIGPVIRTDTISTMLHTFLNFGSSVSGRALLNGDHDMAYPTTGGAHNEGQGGTTYGRVWFRNIGRGGLSGNQSDSGLAINLSDNQLVDDNGTETLDWDKCLLKNPGAVWGVDTTTIFISYDNTVAASGDGAIEVPSGGAYFGAGVYVDKGGANYAGEFSDAPNNLAVTGPDGTNALIASDVTTTTKLCDGTNSVNATHNISTDSDFVIAKSGAVVANTNRGITEVAIGVAGGIVYDNKAMAGGATFESSVLDLMAQGFGV